MRGPSKLVIGVALALVSASGVVGAQTLSVSPQTPDNFSAPPPQPSPLLDYVLGMGFEYSDNVNRAGTGSVGQGILQPMVGFTFNHAGSSVQAQATGLLQYTDYLQGYYDNEFRGQLSGTLNWIIAPQRLNFDLEDYSSVQPVNTRLSNAPNNLQQVNVFITGPTLSFRLGSAMRGEADLRYINTSASQTKDFDSQRGLGAFRLFRDLSATQTLSANAEAVNVDFNNNSTNTVFPHYAQYNLYGRYQSRLSELSLDLAAGASRVVFGQGGGEHGGTLIRASLGWRVTPRNSLQLSASTQLTDSTAGLVQPPNLANTPLNNTTLQVGSTVISPAVFRDSGVYLQYAYQGPRFSLTLTPYYTRLREIDGSTLSRNGYGGIASITYLINPLLQLGLDLGAQNTQYLSDHSRDRDDTVGLHLSQQLAPHWSWSVALIHDGRQSTRPGFSYHENELFATLYFHR